MKAIYFSVLLCFLFPSNTIAQNSKKEQKQIKKLEQFDKTKELIASSNYQFIGKFAMPQKGRQVDLSSRSNFMKIIGNIGQAQMPYIGVAHSAGYPTGDGGIVFDSELEDYKVFENDKKYRVTVTFRIKGKGETYDCTLQAVSIENASLSVSSSRRSLIRYTGRLNQVEKER